MWNPFRKEPKPLRMPLFNGHNEQDVIDAVSSMFRGMGVRPRVNPVEDYVIWFDWKTLEDSTCVRIATGQPQSHNTLR